MKAVLSKPYACAPEGHTVVKYEAGAIVEGEVARMALADNVALEIREIDFETKVEEPEEVKAAPKKKAKKG